MDSRVLFALRALGADVNRLSQIPPELQEWIAKLTAEDLERIRGDVEDDIASEGDKRSGLERARTYREARKSNVVPISVTSR